ncbi:TetR/AcrR family transcriptional regulator [Rhizobium rhizogenes]|uniref:TetR/AcrR family transcriptional regulator n=1 Tax=Rhizobium rhizogenes TaxID=359 RepID=UPI00226FAD88|nr:TetR/AcrR family transcriptional regulator [Rhizobium rhizogenes]
MTIKSERGAVRKPRADAERNRIRLMEVAKAAFAEKGADASLEEIARVAGVGIGTLYRHFPTRDALIGDVYRNETEQLARAATELAGRFPPKEALRQWMVVFVEYIDTKQGMYPALNSLVGGTSTLYAASGPLIGNSMEMLTKRAVESGEIKLDIPPLDLLRAVGGLASNNGPDWKDAAKRMVDIIIAGIEVRPR